jgi:hypothetical protein
MHVGVVLGIYIQKIQHVLGIANKGLGRIQIYSRICIQGCTNLGHQAARATKFCKVVPNICGPSVWKLLDVTLQEPRVLSWFLDSRKICELLRFIIVHP